MNAFDKVWNSLLPELTEDIARLDHRLRKISTEASLFGVKPQMIHDKLNERFWQLVSEVSEQRMTNKGA